MKNSTGRAQGHIGASEVLRLRHNQELSPTRNSRLRRRISVSFRTFPKNPQEIPKKPQEFPRTPKNFQELPRTSEPRISEACVNALHGLKRPRTKGNKELSKKFRSNPRKQLKRQICQDRAGIPRKPRSIRQVQRHMGPGRYLSIYLGNSLKPSNRRTTIELKCFQWK